MTLSVELHIALWVLSELSIPVSADDKADRLLREFSWQQFSDRRASLIWKVMCELRAEEQRVECGAVSDRLGADISELGDRGDLWDLIRPDKTVTRPMLDEICLPYFRRTVQYRKRIPGLAEA